MYIAKLFFLFSFMIGSVSHCLLGQVIPEPSNVVSPIKTWHKNGQLKTESNYKDGKLHGWKRYFSENGDLLGEAEFTDGSGTINVNHENGNIWFSRTYLNGKRHGEQKLWYANGQLRKLENRTIGLKDGIQKSWGRNGSIEVEELYIRGKLKYRKFFDKDGNVIERETFDARIEWDSDSEKN